jgi:hypothetical protein
MCCAKEKLFFDSRSKSLAKLFFDSRSSSKLAGVLNSLYIKIVAEKRNQFRRCT